MPLWTDVTTWSLLGLLTTLLVDFSAASQWSARYSGYSEYPSKEMWTQWYNTDHPASYGGDDESLYSIRKRGWDVCPGYNILSAQCRKVGSSETFTESTFEQVTGLDSLYRPCTKGGLYCRNQDQASGQMCQDYEVRFRCTAVTDEAVYTWVAVLAVVFLVIPIAWVVVINLKRKYCPSNNNSSRDQASANERGSSISTLSDPSVAEPPPSYEALFGGGSPVDTSNFTFGSTRALLENETQGSSSSVNHSSSSGDNPAYSAEPTSPNNNNNSSNTTSNTSRTRILPGMHLPVFSFMRQISVGLPTPPPTYDDAIDKLGVPPLKKDPS